MSFKTPWRTLWRLIGKYPRPVHWGAWNFIKNFRNIHTSHFWCPKSSRLHSGIKNVLQDSWEDALETHRRTSSTNAPRGLKFFHIASSVFVYVIPDIQSYLEPIQESRMSFKTPCLMLCRLLGEYPLPVKQAAWKFEESSLRHICVDVYLCICCSWGMQNVLQDSLEDTKKTWYT